jgi:hypothetical protein
MKRAVESGKWKVEARTARQVLSCKQESQTLRLAGLVLDVSFHFELFTLNSAKGGLE